ncbi:MAG: Ig-like domain-containing protein [Bacteroidia bacterium]
MKTIKTIIVALILNSTFLIFNSPQAEAQGTVTQSIYYTGYTSQCCSANTTPYYCFNDVSAGACGSNIACNTQSFTNPVPAGNIVTQINISYYVICNTGGTATSYINGTTLGTVNLVNGSCTCSSLTWPVTGSTGFTYPCGLAGYNNAAGATETFQACFTTQVCIDRLDLAITYAPANQAVPATQPTSISGPASVCAGVGTNYSCPVVANATGYTWSVPAGWVINSGQGTTSINATAGSAGSICVDAYNLCGTSAQTCIPVSILPVSTAPASASANPNPICPGATTTLTASGGSTNTGDTYTWYSGGCGGPVIGTGASVTVTPAVATTYYVAVVGTCNTTACANVLVNMGGAQPIPGAPSGATTPCNGSPQAYTTTGSAGATSYTWSVTGGGTISSGQGTTSINVTTGSSAGNVCVYATGACGVSATACTPITITNIPTTPGSITGTTPVCPGSDNYSVGAVAGATSYIWATTGGGTITGGQGTTAATINWTTGGSYIVSVTASNSCGTSTSATFPVTVNPNPNITITPSSTTICSGGSVATLTASGGVSYTWTPDPTILSGLTAAVVTVSPTNTTTATVYTVTAIDNNGCTNTATQAISVSPSPTVTVSGGGPNSQTVCSGAAIAPINFSVTPAGTVTWTNNNTAIGLAVSSSGNIPGYTAPSVTVQTIGVITANATSGSGCSSTSSTNLTYTITINSPPGPPVITGGTPNPMQECQNISPAVTLTVAPAGGAIPVWYNGTTFLTTGNTYTPPNTTVGTTVYTVIDSSTSTSCGSASGGSAITITVTINPLPPTPTFSLPTTANDTSCQGSPPVLTVNSGTSTAVWYQGTTFLHAGSSYTPPTSLVPGTYTYSVIDSVSVPNGCVNAQQSANTVTLSLVVNPSPPPPTTTSNTLTTECQGLIPAITLSVTPAAGSTPVWYNATTGGVVAIGANTYTPPNATAGSTTYIVIDSSTVNPNTCTSAAAGNVLTFSVVINPSPISPIITAPTGTNNTSCQGSPSALTVSSGTATPTPTPVWYSGNTFLQTGSSYTPPASLAPGTYTYSVIDSIPMPGGCISAPASANTVTLSLVVYPSPPAPILTNTINPVVECQYQSPAITLSVTPTGTITSVPVWYNGTTYLAIGNTYTPPDATAGTTFYTVIDSSTVLPNTCTSASAGNVLTIGVIVNLTPTTPTLSTANSNNVNECQGGSATTLSVTPAVGSTPVWYSSASSGAVAIGSTYTPPNTIVSPPPIVYTVIDSATTLPPTGCTSSLTGNALTVTVTVHPAPTINVTNLTTLDSANCGKAGTLSVSPSAITGLGTGPLHYQWYDNGVAILYDTTLILTGAAGGTTNTYSLQVTDSLGCNAIAAAGTGTTFTVPAVASPIISFSTNPSPAIGYIPLVVTFTNQTTGATSYTWTFGDGNSSNAVSPTYTYISTGNSANTGTFTVMLIAMNGSCKDTAQTTVIVDLPTMLIIPNVFSPNGDNINDQFFIVNTGMSSLNCDIFNRWGQLLFTITAPDQSWDGKTPNGDNAPDGTYMYMLQAQGLNGKAYKQQGTVTLIR